MFIPPWLSISYPKKSSQNPKFYVQSCSSWPYLQYFFWRKLSDHPKVGANWGQYGVLTKAGILQTVPKRLTTPRGQLRVCVETRTRRSESTLSQPQWGSVELIRVCTLTTAGIWGEVLWRGKTPHSALTPLPGGVQGWRVGVVHLGTGQ